MDTLTIVFFVLLVGALAVCVYFPVIVVGALYLALMAVFVALLWFIAESFAEMWRYANGVE